MLQINAAGASLIGSFGVPGGGAHVQLSRSVYISLSTTSAQRLQQQQSVHTHTHTHTASPPARRRPSQSTTGANRYVPCSLSHTPTGRSSRQIMSEHKEHPSAALRTANGEVPNGPHARWPSLCSDGQQWIFNWINVIATMTKILAADNPPI